MKYENGADVKMRLEGSVVRYKGQPVYVISTSGDKCKILLLDTDEETLVLYTSLDLSPVPLGFVCTGKAMAYVERRPVRRFKQGLTKDNMFVKDAPWPVARISNTDKCLANTISGKYPSIEEAFQDVREGKRIAVPFSREWGVAKYDGDLCIVHRGDIVGYVTDNVVRLLPEKHFLKESLECNLM